MSLRGRVAGVALVLMLLIISAWVLINRIHGAVAEENRNISEVLQPASVDARELSGALTSQETGARGFVITGDGAFLEPYRDGQERAAAELAELRAAFPATEGTGQQIETVAEAIAEWQLIGPEAQIETRRQTDDLEPQQLIASGEARLALERVRTELSALNNLIDTRLALARERSSEQFDRLRRLLLWELSALGLMVLFSLFLIRVWILAPVDRLRAGLRRVTEGDLQHLIQIEGPPDFQRVAEDAEAMRKRIIAELDQTRAASEALDQHGPAVVALIEQLQPSMVPRLSGLEVFGGSHPAEGLLAGDWWDVVAHRPGLTSVLICDVSGHGPEACLVAARFKHRITALLKANLSPVAAMRTAAIDLDRDGERFLSVIIATVDSDKRELRWINAGHPPGIVVRGENGVFRGRLLQPTGPLVSWIGGEWTEASVGIDNQDLLILTTDGVVEARRGNEEFGVRRVIASAVRAPGDGLSGAVESILEDVRLFATDWRRDDVTVVAARLVD